MIFHNRRYFQKQSFEISDKSLLIHKKGMFDEIEYEIPLETISNKKSIKTQINNNMIISGVFFFAFSFLFLLGSVKELTVILAAIGVIFIIAAFINRKKIVSVATYPDERIILYFNKSNKQEVIDFSNEMIKASNAYLLKKYGKIDKALPALAQLDNLKFLLDREVISDSDFELFKNQLFGRDGNSIGFGQ